jgi:DNA-binding NtrC family response regulator
VENDAITAVALQRTVTRLGHQVVARATSAADAMAAVQAYRPDAVLLDVLLAGPFDGIQVGTDIQALWSTPVIYLSGAPLTELGIPDFPEALWCFLAKPIDWEQLRDLLAQLFPSQPPHAVGRTTQELREPLRALQAHLASLQQQAKDALTTAEARCEEVQRLSQRVGPADDPPARA